MNKKDVVFIVLVVAAVGILVFSNVWLFLRTENLQSQVNSLEAQKIELQTQVGNLELDKSLLETQVSSLESDNGGLESQVENLNSQVGSLDSQVSSLNSQVTNLQNDVAYGDSEIERLTDIIDTLKNEAIARDNESYQKDREIDDLNSQITSLTDQLNGLKEPKLVNVGVGADDKRPDSGRPYLYVYGWVFNVGKDAAISTNLHVTAYFLNGTVAIDTYINMGLIGGGYSRNLNYSIYYDGPPLDMTRVTITPELTDNQ